MKNITALVVLVIITGALYGQQKQKERNYEFKAGWQIGFVSGEAVEIVYPDNTTKGEYLSELIWEVSPLIYFGAQLDFGLIDPLKKPGFSSSLSFKAGIPGDTGKLEDRDWQSTENSSLTDFSSHTNYTKGFYWLDLNAGFSIPVKRLFFIKPFLSGSWMHFAFTGRDGYGKYTGWFDGKYYDYDTNPYEQEYSGDVIRYTQNWIIISMGLMAGIRLRDRYSIDLSFQLSPLTFCFDEDHHIGRNVVFKDNTRWGLLIEPGVRLGFRAKEWLELSLDIAYRYIGETKGETYINDNNSGFYLAQSKAGAGLSLFNSSLTAKIIF